MALIKRKGEIIDDDLARLVARGDDSTTDELLQKELMNLEIQGIVTISQITKTRKRVKLQNTDMLNPELLKGMN